MTTKATSAPSEIELSSLYWYHKRLPQAVDLIDCSLSLPLVNGGMHGLFGHRGKHEGFMAARWRAEESDHTYAVVDFRVQLSHKVEQRKHDADSMAEHEVFPAQSLRKEFAIELDTRIRHKHNWRRRYEDELTSDCLLKTLAEHPSAINDLMAMSELKHVRMFVYLAKLSFSAEPVPVGVIPDRHMRHITVAESRLDPDLGIRLPKRTRHAHADGVAAPTLTPAPKHR